MSRRKVIIIYGGESTEHEVSCRSAAYLFKSLDRTKYDVFAIGIDKQGHWHLQDVKQIEKNLKDSVPLQVGMQTNSEVSLPVSLDPSASLPAAVDTILGTRKIERSTIASHRDEIVVFPMLHGPLGEDGTIQGLFEISHVAYVGPETLGSAIGMDKIVSKKLALAAGIPVVPFLEVRPHDWKDDPLKMEEMVRARLTLPIFVKPASLGSSVGISKVNDWGILATAINFSFQFDTKVIVEQGIEAREIECAVMGLDRPRVSIPGEVIPTRDFYSYEAKYLDKDGAEVSIPAKLTPAQTQTAQELSAKIFTALELSGMARVDLFLEKGSDEFFFNEVNTIPGFTNISQFPLLWQHSGLTPQQILDELIDIALERKRRKDLLRRSL